MSNKDAMQDVLRELFEGIRDERRTNANTATRIGNALLALLDFSGDGTKLSKVMDDETPFNIKMKGLEATSILVEDDSEVMENVPVSSVMSRAVVEDKPSEDAPPAGTMNPGDISWGQLQNIDPTVDGMGRGLYALEKLRSGMFTVTSLTETVKTLLGDNMPMQILSLDEYDAIEDKGRVLYFIMYGTELHYIYFGSTLIARKGKSEGEGNNGFPYTFPFNF